MPGRVEGLCLIVTLCVDCKEAFGNRFKNILVRSKYNILTKYRIVSISNPWVFARISNKTHLGEIITILPKLIYVVEIAQLTGFLQFKEQLLKKKTISTLFCVCVTES